MGNKSKLKNKQFYKKVNVSLDPLRAGQPLLLGDVMGYIQTARKQKNHQAVAYIAGQIIGFIPKDVELRITLIESLHSIGDYSGVVDLSKQGQVLFPKREEFYAFCSAAYRELDLVESALHEFEKLIVLLPDSSKYWCFKGMCHVELGDKDEALDSFNKSILLDRNNAYAYFNRSEFLKESVSESDSQYMEQVLRQSSLSIQEKIYFNFALAYAYEVAGNKEREFQCLLDGNKLVFEQRGGYKHTEVSARCDKVIQRFGRYFFESAPLEDHKHIVDPIFIVGMPRSGSSLTEKILSAHSSVHAGGESVIIPMILTQIKSEMSIENLLWEMEGEQLDKLIIRARQLHEKYLQSQQLNSPVYVDKSLNNYEYLWLILKIYPRAKVIHTYRHPLDVILSAFRIVFNHGLAYSFSLEALAQQYLIHERYMVHWSKMKPGNVLSFSHQDLLADQRGQTQKLLDFCGLEWEESCMEYYKSGSAVNTMSRHQVNKGIDPTMKDKWREYEAYLQPALDIINDKRDCK